MLVVKGDVFKALNTGEIDYVMHCCNAQGVMGSGIAKLVKEMYPDAFLAYCNNHSLGAVSIEDGIINVVAQQTYGTDRRVRYISYDALVTACEKVNDLIQGKVIGIPYLFGSDRAGGDWEIVSRIIKRTITSSQVKAYRLRG